MEAARPYVSSVIAAAVFLAACGAPTSEHVYVHLADTHPEEDGRYYTLNAETRPVLQLPEERRLRVDVPATAAGTHRVVLRNARAGRWVAVTGTMTRGRRTVRLRPQWREIARTTDGGFGIDLDLPVQRDRSAEPGWLSLVITPAPSSAAVDQRVKPVTVPDGASLRFAYGLSEAARARGDAEIRMEIAALAQGATEPQPIWSTTLAVSDAETHRWTEAVVSLDALAGQQVTLIFRASAVGDSPALVTPVWGDPTIVSSRRGRSMQRNVVLISLDTLRADRVGAYGAYRPTTPRIDELAAEAAVFTSAWSPWPETSGAHMSLFTSLYPSAHGVRSFIDRAPRSVTLLAERLREAGYLTRAFTENGGVWAKAGFARGFGAYSERRTADRVYRGEAEATFSDAIDWLDRHATDRFFLFVHTYEVHAPYTPKFHYQSMFSDIPGREPAPFVEAALAYDREVVFLDQQVGRLTDALARLELGDRTIVVITSDHGEEFGEHGSHGHGRTLHPEVLRVPLLFRAPGLVRPGTVGARVSLLDVAPTLVDLLGLDADPQHRGISLAPELTARSGGEPRRELAERELFAELDRDERGKLYRATAVRGPQGAALVDAQAGTAICTAGADSALPADDPRCRRLLAAIEAHRTEPRAPAVSAQIDADDEVVEKMRALGYLD